MTTNDLKYNQLHLILSSLPLNLAFIFILLGANLPSWLVVILLPTIFVAIGHLILKLYFRYVWNNGVSKFKFYFLVFIIGISLLIVNIGIMILINN